MANDCSPEASEGLALPFHPQQDGTQLRWETEAAGQSPALVSVPVRLSCSVPAPFPRLCGKGGRHPPLPAGAGAEPRPARLGHFPPELPKALLSLPVTLRVCWLLQPKHSTGAFKKAPPIRCFKCKEPVLCLSASHVPPPSVGDAGTMMLRLGLAPPWAGVTLSRSPTCHISWAHASAVTTWLD